MGAKEVRQRIDKQSFAMTWAIQEEIIEEVKTGGVTDQHEAKEAAQQIWGEVCFTAEIYRTAQGDEGTQAEFMQRWLRSGWTWKVCKRSLKELTLTEASKRALDVPEASIMDGKRAVSPSYKKRTPQWLRENIVRNLRPRGKGEGKGSESDSSNDGSDTTPFAR